MFATSSASPSMVFLFEWTKSSRHPLLVVALQPVRRPETLVHGEACHQLEVPRCLLPIPVQIGASQCQHLVVIVYRPMLVVQPHPPERRGVFRQDGPCLTGALLLIILFLLRCCSSSPSTFLSWQVVICEFLLSSCCTPGRVPLSSPSNG